MACDAPTGVDTLFTFAHTVEVQPDAPQPDGPQLSKWGFVPGAEPTMHIDLAQLGATVRAPQHATSTSRSTGADLLGDKTFAHVYGSATESTTPIDAAADSTRSPHSALATEAPPAAVGVSPFTSRTPAGPAPRALRTPATAPEPPKTLLDVETAMHAVRRLSHQLDVIPEASSSPASAAMLPPSLQASVPSPAEPAGGGPLPLVGPGSVAVGTQERGDTTRGLLQDELLSPLVPMGMVCHVCCYVNRSTDGWLLTAVDALFCCFAVHEQCDDSHRAAAPHSCALT